MNERQEPVYDDRGNQTLKGLLRGKTRETLAAEFNLSTWKSLDIYMRRKGFAWDGANTTYIPAINKVDKVMDEISSSVPIKAERVIKKFKELGDDGDPRAIAKEFGFGDHRELGDYMESKSLFWDSEEKNYTPMVKDFLEENQPENEKYDSGIKQQVESIEPEKLKVESLEKYLPLLKILQDNEDRLLTLLLPQTNGQVPKYAVPGVAKSKSIYMSDLLSRLMAEFSESKNISQRDIVEAALIEYLKRYGYQTEVEKLLGKR